MASDVDISNLALSFVGDRASVNAIDGSDTSVQAAQCKRFFPLARDEVLTAHAWSFATKRVVLAALTIDATNDDWDYKYSVPNLAMKVLAVLPQNATDAHEGVPFMLENSAIYTNEESAEARYIYKETNTGKYSQEVVTAMARLLASFLAGPLIKGREGRQESRNQFELYLVQLATAKSADANQSLDIHDYVPAGITARQAASANAPLILPPNWPR
jgi:hypothetical protein